ncbi:MAG: alkaline phosphatase family protein, partial [Steroidobacteraceae bacterium]
SAGKRRIIAVNLDGYEYSLAERMMAAGELPAMAELAGRSARFLLDHGSDLRTGLAGEHVATGLSADAAGRWAAVHFDPGTYEVWQQGTALEPFPAKFSFDTVVLDPPYFDLGRAPQVRGIVSWGAHDPGVAPAARPDGLWDEMQARFGPYPAANWIYGTPWNSEALSKEMGDRLEAAVRQRTDVAIWLIGQRLPDWELALLAVSEAHSAIEGLWHGVDERHPLRDVPSSKVAGAGVRAVYRAIDDFIARLRAAFPDATFVVYSMHGMGANGSDAPSMLLLAELLYRRAFGAALHETVAFERLPAGPPAMPESLSWGHAVFAGFRRSRGAKLRDFSRRALRRLVPKPLRTSHRDRSFTPPRAAGPAAQSLAWMPATAYRRFWPQMQA